MRSIASLASALVVNSTGRTKKESRCDAKGWFARMRSWQKSTSGWVGYVRELRSRVWMKRWTMGQ